MGVEDDGLRGVMWDVGFGRVDKMWVDGMMGELDVRGKN